MRSEGRIDAFLNALGKEWKRQGVDLRFAQFMVNNGLSNLDALYQYEEAEIMEGNFPDIDQREYKMWGTYGKDGNQVLKHSPIMSMNTDHIEAILRDVKNGMKIDDSYVILFEKELRLRKLKKYKKEI